MEVNYPKLPKNDWQSVKISDKDHDEINKLRWVDGFTLKHIAEIFNVSQYTISYHTNPEFRENQLKKSYEKMQRYMKDPFYATKYRKQKNEWRKSTIQKRPELKEWISGIGKSRDKQKISEYNKKHYLERKMRCKK